MAACRMVGVAGGTGSGKTFLASALRRLAGPDAVDVVPLDAYYRSREHLPPGERARVNYDHPAALESPLLVTDVRRLGDGIAVPIPQYDFATHVRSPATRLVEPRPVILIEGILALHFPEVRALLAYSVFVDTPEALRFSRRLARDVAERGRTEASVRAQWNETVQPMHAEFCEPTRRFASEIFSGISWSEEDVAALWARVRGAPWSAPPA